MSLQLMRHVSVVAAMLIAMPGITLGQDGKDETIQKLIARVEALERQVAALQQTGVPAADTAQPEPSALVPKQEPTAPVSPPTPELEASRYNFHAYADAGFNRNLEGSSVKRFVLGEVDLFATARISPKLTALIETVLETDNQVTNASVPVNVERLLLQYRRNDYFNLDIGSYRTAVGFYSTAYLRGSWLQTALTRPMLFTFEDQGGFLPLHNVGLSANGRLPSGDLGLHYVVEVGSSRNYAHPGRTGLDFEQNGAFNAALYARPRAIHGLEVGLSWYRDKFSPVPGFSLSRSISTAHAIYQANRFEFLNEAILERFSEPRFGHGTVAGLYSQLAYRLGSDWTPYFRFDYANVYGVGVVGADAPQYVPWRTVFSGGLRYDITEAVALKFEAGRETDRSRPPWIRTALQVAFTF